MRPLSFDPQDLRKHLLRHKIATLPELKAALGTSADLTVFRKLKLLDYLSSYTHRGRYYALREAARFDDIGLWSHDAVWFSRYGTDDCIACKGSKGPRAMEDKDSPAVEQIRVRNCTFKRGGGVLTCGSEATIVRDVIAEDCKITGGVRIATLKLRPDTPQHYEDITFRNITSEGPPAASSTWRRGRSISISGAWSRLNPLSRT